MFALLAVESFNAFAAALAMGLTGFGAALAMGIGLGKAVDAIGRQPEADGKIRTTLIFGFAFCETIAIYGLLISILLIAM